MKVLCLLVLRGGISRAYDKVYSEGISDGAPMRERERVANYLELPNNSTTFLQENCCFPVPCIYFYNKKIGA